MPYHDPEASRRYKKDWYKRHCDEVRARTQLSRPKYKKRAKDYVWKIKAETPCVDCNCKFHPVAMDFDHISQDKEAEIARLVNNGCSIERIAREIAKCELVCANCHRVRTWSRQHKAQVAQSAEASASRAEG